jgi:predicted transcriptional regulator with HTH domain
MAQDDQSRREDIRRETLQHLYDRRPLRQEVATIARRVSRQLGEVGAREIDEALDFLSDLQLVDSKRDRLGATQYWRCTAAGALQVERGE